MFQSTHPRRVWLWKEGYERCWLRFQSTHPRRVWPHRGHTASSAVCFNPHTHAGCDKGVWDPRAVQKGFNPHTHAGCDPIETAQFSWDTRFNPHTHAGCDYRYPAMRNLCPMFQSTHPRRVWHRTWALPLHRRVSIHTPTQGVTLWDSKNTNVLKFQSTHPRRVWQDTTGATGKYLHGFNPHTHAGCDFLMQI